MNVHEANRVRHLMIRLDRGDELPAALVRALDEAEARSGVITGVGTLEAAELCHYDQAHAAYEKPRRIDGATELAALSGNVALLDGAASVHLCAVLSRETDLGLSTCAGQLIWARAFSVELHVVVFDDLSLTRVADPRTGLPVLAARPASAADAPAARPSPQASAVTTGSPGGASVTTGSPGGAPHAAPAAIPLPAPAAPVATSGASGPAAAPDREGPAIPQRRQKPQDDIEVYPEVGDTVSHFAFGECTVIGSEGDRIRLRQDKDGRVREVALTMLRIEPSDPSAPEGEGSRHFMLHRKN